MAEYHYWFHDLVTNVRLGELELENVSYGRVLNGAGAFRGSLPLGDPQVLAQNPVGITQPPRTRVYVERDGVLVWGGVLWQRYFSQPAVLSLGAKELWSYFQSRSNVGRFITDSLSFTQKDQLAIARDLLAYAQGQQMNAVAGAPKTIPKPGGNLGILLGTETSGVLRDRSYDATAYQEIAQMVEELSAVLGGFDFSIDVAYAAGVATATFVLGYPRRGVSYTTGIGIVFEEPGNIESYEFPEDGTQFADTSFALGDGEGSAMMRSSSSRTDLLDAGYPLIEQRRSYKSSGITNQSTLDDHAFADVNAAVAAGPFPTLVVRGDGPISVGSFTTGDDCRLRITDERFPNPGYGGANQALDSYYRIVAYEVEVGPPETIKVTLGAVS